MCKVGVIGRRTLALLKDKLGHLMGRADFTNERLAM